MQIYTTDNNSEIRHSNVYSKFCNVFVAPMPICPRVVSSFYFDRERYLYIVVVVAAVVVASAAVVVEEEKGK